MDIHEPGFLKLPIELRHNLFAHLVTLGENFAIERDTHAPNVGQVRKLRTKDRSLLWRWNKVTPLLLINHAVTSEVLDLLYGRNTFVFDDPWLIETFIVRIGAANLARIAHVSVQGGNLQRRHNTASTTTLFSIISSWFSNLQTLRIIGVGRGHTKNGFYDPKWWLPAHLERLQFITTLPGVLRGARVYCDKDEQNSRLLCNNAEYRVESDEMEVNMATANCDDKAYKRYEKKRDAARVRGDGDTSEVEDLKVRVTEQTARKRPKVGPSYQWKC